MSKKLICNDGKVCKNRVSLTQHIIVCKKSNEKKVCTEEELTCNTCQKVFKSKSGLTRHRCKGRKKLKEELFCKYCGKFCKNQQGLTKHEIQCSSNPNRILKKITNIIINKPCRFCGKICKNQSGLTKHQRLCKGAVVQKVYTKEDLTCKFCKNIFKNLNGLHYHENRCNLNSSKISFKGFCKFCNREFLYKNGLHHHEIVCKQNKDRKVITISQEHKEKISQSNKNKNVSIETRKKIGLKSKGRKYPNRRKPIWNLEQHQKRSLSAIKRLEDRERKWMTGLEKRNKRKMTYGEEQLHNIFLKNKVYEKYDIVNEYFVGRYAIDFAFINEKVAVEFDGGLHFNDDGSRIEHDIVRDSYLNGRGWRMYRIPYNEMRTFKIEDLLSFIGNPEIKNYQPDLIKYREVMRLKKEVKESKFRILEDSKKSHFWISIVSENEEVKTKMIPKNEFDSYRERGWARGRSKRNR